jgi:hypothetical protein
VRCVDLSAELSLKSLGASPKTPPFAGFEQSVRAWATGSEYVKLTPEQCGEAQVAP